MKKIISIIMLLGSVSAFAQTVNLVTGTPSVYVESCNSNGGLAVCQIGGNVPSAPATPAANNFSTVNPASYTTGTVAAPTAPNIKGSYNSSVPGGNVFAFCSGGRPGRHNPLRAVYDSICPAGKS